MSVSTSLPDLPYRPPTTGIARSSTGFGWADPMMAIATRGAAVSILVMLGVLLVVLTVAALPGARKFGWHFLVGQEWRANSLEVPKKDANGHPVIEDGEVQTEEIPPAFGALPVIWGTAVSSVLSLVLAVPLSFGAALFLTRLAPKFMVGPVSFLIEFLAAIPSIAYGIWGLFALAPLLQLHVEPLLQDIFGKVPGFSMLFREHVVIGGHEIIRALPLTGRDMFCGAIVLSVMIIPIITAVSRDVLRSVPRAQIEGSVALGATWWQSCVEMLKFSRSALFGAVMLGLARAAGETMAITMVIGNANQIRLSPFAPAQTMSSLLANQFAEAEPSLQVPALCEVALVLLLMSLAFNMVARSLVVGNGSRPASAS